MSSRRDACGPREETTIESEELVGGSAPAICADGAFTIADGEQLPFASESFDVVYSNGVLHHTPDTAGAIREVDTRRTEVLSRAISDTTLEKLRRRIGWNVIVTATK